MILKISANNYPCLGKERRERGKNIFFLAKCLLKRLLASEGRVLVGFFFI
jgi:hypothetical protein